MSDKDFDYAPILITKGPKPAEPEEIEEQPIVTTVEELEVADPFAPIIRKLSKTESPVVWRAVQDTPCFARLWHNEQDGSYCTEMDCQLRGLCELSYHQAVGFPAAPEEPKQVAPPRAAPRPLVRPPEARRQAKKNKIRLASSFKRAAAFAYIDQGRPVDAFAQALWQKLGEPKELPPEWDYGVAATMEQRKEARASFIKEYGDGLLVTRRSSYHQYFFNGIHVCRLWVSTGSSAWLDCCLELARGLNAKGYRLAPVTPKDRRHRFQWYEFKIKVRTAEDIEGAAAVMRSILSTLEVH